MNRIDFVSHSFSRALFGYNRAQVDRLVRDLSDSLSRVTEEKIALAAKVRELEAGFSEVKERESALQEALTAARDAGGIIRESAQKEAQLVLETARLKADGMLQNANARLARVMEEAANAKKIKALFEMKLKAIIEDHLRLLSLNRQESASLEAATQKLAGTNPLPTLVNQGADQSPDQGDETSDA